MRVGIGYDVHQLVEGRELVLGGVNIPHEKGLAGHSDADVLLHAIMDALLGAMALGDIGKHFPDTSSEYKNISSIVLLKSVAETMVGQGYSIINLDATIVAERPKMAQYIDLMRINIANVLKCTTNQVNIKATTTEKLGFEGEELGISSQAIVLLKKMEV